MKNIPLKVKEAFQHIKEQIPCVDAVIYGKDGRWLYVSSEFLSEPIAFKYVNVDTSLLEEASDAIANMDVPMPVLFREDELV